MTHSNMPDPLVNKNVNQPTNVNTQTVLSQTAGEIPFTMIPNELIANKTLSPSATFLLIFLLSHRSDWIFNDSYLKKRMACEQGKLKLLFKELREEGYVRNVRIPGKNGQKLGTKRIFSRVPEFKKPLSTESTKNRPSAFPTVGKTHRINNTDLVNNTNNKNNNNKESPPSIDNPVCLKEAYQYAYNRQATSETTTETTNNNKVNTQTVETDLVVVKKIVVEPVEPREELGYTAPPPPPTLDVKDQLIKLGIIPHVADKVIREYAITKIRDLLKNSHHLKAENPAGKFIWHLKNNVPLGPQNASKPPSQSRNEPCDALKEAEQRMQIAKDPKNREAGEKFLKAIKGTYTKVET